LTNYTVSQQSVACLIFYNAKKDAEPVIIDFGAQSLFSETRV